MCPRNAESKCAALLVQAIQARSLTCNYDPALSLGSGVRL